jgi:hypothetical protein
MVKYPKELSQIKMLSCPTTEMPFKPPFMGSTQPLSPFDDVKPPNKIKPASGSLNMVFEGVSVGA